MPLSWFACGTEPCVSTRFRRPQSRQHCSVVVPVAELEPPAHAVTVSRLTTIVLYSWDSLSQVLSWVVWPLQKHLQACSLCQGRGAATADVLASYAVTETDDARLLMPKKQNRETPLGQQQAQPSAGTPPLSSCLQRRPRDRLFAEPELADTVHCRAIAGPVSREPALAELLLVWTGLRACTCATAAVAVARASWSSPRSGIRCQAAARADGHTFILCCLHHAA